MFTTFVPHFNLLRVQQFFSQCPWHTKSLMIMSLSMQMTAFLPNSMYTTHGNFMFVFLNFTHKMYLKMQVTAPQNAGYCSSKCRLYFQICKIWPTLLVLDFFQQNCSLFCLHIWYRYTVWSFVDCIVITNFCCFFYGPCYSLVKVADSFFSK